MKPNLKIRKLLEESIWGKEITLLTKLEEARDSRPIVVGGAVRDALLDRPIKDMDISTAVPDSASALASAFARAANRTLVQYSHERTVYRVVAEGSPQVDFTDPVGGNRESDLLRRDFTINAIGFGLIGNEAGVIFDPSNGIADISARLIRVPSNNVLDDDPLRMLRAFRFSQELGFLIHEDTLLAIKSKARAIKNIPGERIQHELMAALEPDGSASLIVSIDNAGLLGEMFPRLMETKNVSQNAYHHLDVWSHTLAALTELEEVFRFNEPVVIPYRERILEYINFRFPSGHSRLSLIKLAALFHDIAKPICRGTREDGRITFIGHERIGADLVAQILSRLKFPNYERDFVTEIIRGHLRPILMKGEEKEAIRLAYKFFREFEDSALGILLFSLADRFAAQGELVTPEIIERHRRTVAFLLECLFERANVVIRPPVLLDGEELMKELGIQQGPLVGYLLDSIREAQATGIVNNREEALELCRRITSQ